MDVVSCSVLLDSALCSLGWRPLFPVRDSRRPRSRTRHRRQFPPEQRPEYKAFTVAAGDSVEDVFNAVAREGFQYAGSAQRHTEFIFVKWVRIEPVVAEDASS
jgi:hypothetical protein